MCASCGCQRGQNLGLSLKAGICETLTVAGGRCRLLRGLRPNAGSCDWFVRQQGLTQLPDLAANWVACMAITDVLAGVGDLGMRRIDLLQMIPCD